MRNKIHPKQITIFDALEDRSVVERERESRFGLCHNYNNIISIDNLLSAWREFLCGKRKRKDIEEFSLNLTGNIFALYRELIDKTYSHGGYRAFKINDPKPRDIHKASVRDRLLHHAIYRILYPYFDRKFIFDSYSCRLGKGTHCAERRFKNYAGIVSRNHKRAAWVLKCDIRKFFASIDHEILQNILRKHIKDEDVMCLLNKIIGSFHTKDRSGVGLPLGNLTSQLLVNIYMNEFDHFMKRVLKEHYYIRYADDFVVLHGNKKYLENLLPLISDFLRINLKLALHPDKVSIKTFASGVDFLGWVNFSKHRVLRTSTKNRMFKRLNGNKYKLESAISYLGLLSHGNAYKLEEEILKNKEILDPEMNSG